MQKALTDKTTQHSDKSLLYIIFFVLSIVISWGIFAQFLFSGSASIPSFFQQALATPIATLLSSDVILSALIFLAFAHIELKRLGMPANRLALYTLATFSVGVCCALSLFLYQRERWINNVAKL